MPRYTYQIINEDGSDGPLIEIVHGMNEPPLTHDPKTGRPVRRVFSPPHIAGWGNSRVAAQMISDQNVERLGFTKYARVGKGCYERRVGSGGPSQLIVKDDGT